MQTPSAAFQEMSRRDHPKAASFVGCASPVFYKIGSPIRSRGYGVLYLWSVTRVPWYTVPPPIPISMSTSTSTSLSIPIPTPVSMSTSTPLSISKHTQYRQQQEQQQYQRNPNININIDISTRIATAAPFRHRSVSCAQPLRASGAVSYTHLTLPTIYSV